MHAMLDDIEFLARSHNRVSALETLSDEPRDRAGLRESIGASSSTVGRVLNDLTEKGWVTRRGRRYESTPLGELIGREFVRLLDTMETATPLCEELRWLPTDDDAFELRALDDAVLTDSTRTDPFAPIDRLATRLWDARRVRVLTHAVTTLTPWLNGGTDAGSEQTFAAVLTPDVADVVTTSPKLTERIRTLFWSGGTEIRCHAGHIPYNVVIADDTVLFVGVDDERHLPQKLIESTDERVVAWAESTYESYRENATVVELNELAA